MRARPPVHGGEPPPGAGGLLVLLAWAALLVAAIASLHAVGGPLAPPPLDDPARLGGWLDQRQAAEAAVAVVRLLALGMAWYLLATTVVATCARLAGVVPLVRAADAVTLPAVRRLVSGALGVSMAAASFTGAAGAAAGADERTGSAAGSTTAETMRRLPGAGAERPPPATVAPEEPVARETSPPPTMRRLPDPVAEGAASPAPAGPGAEDVGTGGPPPTLRRLPTARAEEAAGSPDGAVPEPSQGSGTPAIPPIRPSEPPDAETEPPSEPARPSMTGNSTTTTTRPTTGPPTTGSVSSPARARPAVPTAGPIPSAGPDTDAAAAGRTWRVRPGDHFWSVAERVLAEASQRHPTDAEIDAYWRALIEANEAVLRDPGNPDLLFPDQVITVPAPRAPKP